MSELNPISISIVLQTLPLTQKGFGLALVLGTGASEKAYVEIVEGAELVDAGYTTEDAEYKMAQAFFSQNPRPEKLAVYRRINTDSITEALTALILEHNNWYALLITERTKAALNEAGTWVGSNEKIFIGCTDDETALSGRNQIREAYLLHSDPTTYPDAAWLGSCITYTPGSITWAYKKANGVTDSGFNTTDTNAIITNGNVFGTLAGVVVSYPGITTGQEFIDIITARDYVVARLHEELSRILIITPKIPYTLQGFALVESAVRSVLKDAGTKGIIATVDSDEDKTRSDEMVYQYKIYTPRSLDEIPANDRANRKMPMNFSFRIAGALHKIDVTGVVTI